MSALKTGFHYLGVNLGRLFAVLAAMLGPSLVFIIVLEAARYIGLPHRFGGPREWFSMALQIALLGTYLIVPLSVGVIGVRFLCTERGVSALTCSGCYPPTLAAVVVAQVALARDTTRRMEFGRKFDKIA